jgi:hypothetical protein
MGRVWSKKTQRYLKLNKINSGYLTVYIPAANGKYKRELVHRLVALAFIDNPTGLPQVNHRDENKENNCVDNLEWISAKSNMIYSHGKAVRCVELNKVFVSTGEAARALGIDAGDIGRCCKGIRKTCGGYHWECA